MTGAIGRPRIVVAGDVDLSAIRAIGEVTTLADDAPERPDLVIVAGTPQELRARLSLIRDAPDTAWAPILAICADDDAVAALDAGADGVIDPRARPQELTARALALLRLKRRHDEVDARAAQFTDWTRTLVTQVADQVEQLQRAERLRRFLSPRVADVVAGDARLLESHRREIVVVVCELRGFTAFSETAEPEEVMGVLREYHAVLGALIYQFEATLERFAGDAILAFFNDPVPCPDPAARAVRMAVAMREQVRELARGWRKRDHQLDFGVGITLGHATLGRVGFEGRSDYGAVGSIVNLASRLGVEALGGQILISERVYALVEDIADVEELPALPLEGLPEAGARPERHRAPRAREMRPSAILSRSRWREAS